jgi:hypothetical protein
MLKGKYTIVAFNSIGFPYAWDTNIIDMKEDHGRIIITHKPKGKRQAFKHTYDKDNETLFTNLMSILAGVIGGVLTLSGVGLTLKYQKEETNKELKIKNIPYLFINKNEEVDYNYDLNAMYFQDYENWNYDYCLIINTYIKVSNDSNCILSGLIINDKYYKLYESIFLEKNIRFNLNIFALPYKYNEGENIMQLVVTDTLQNFYKLKVKGYLINENSKMLILHNNEDEKKHVLYIPEMIMMPKDLTSEEYSYFKNDN